MNFTKCPFTSSSCQDGERKLWWKRSLFLSVGLLRNEAFTPFIAELRRFRAQGPDRKSVRPVSDVNLHPSMTGDSTERPGENRRIDRLVETIQRNRWAEGAERFSYLPSIPPSLQTATCFKEQNFIKLCHSVFVSPHGGGVACVGVCWRIRASPQKSY